ncbi:MAG: Tol-Pal system protein TolB [Magnetococcales bacterium]|nr:Tol-Pal system protein TolB [Magnetococcales bacterium]
MANRLNRFSLTTPHSQPFFGRWVYGLALLLWALVATTGLAEAGMVIDISKGGQEPLPIALPHFINLNAQGNVKKISNSSDDMGRRVASVVMADLERSGLFKPLDEKAYLQKPDDLWKQGPHYRNWRLIGAEALVSGAVREKGGQLFVDFYLYDVYGGALVGKGKRFTAPLRDWRHVAHRVADEIYTRLTGESGYFTSRISFVAEKGDLKWLALMDQDGENRVDLTKGQSLVLTPRFSPNGEHLFFVSYEKGPPRIYRWDLYTGKRVLQGDYPGLNSAPSWSPDGNRMALTLTKDGNAEIYIKDLRTGDLTRLTHNNGIDTSPSWSPDGRKLVFNSNRSGSPQLYVMDANGQNVKRITFDGPYNAAPAWSPRGDYIAYVRGGSRRFRIAVTDPEGQKNHILTDSWMDESPSWAPNGRVILFSRQVGSQTQLYTIDLTGHNERLLKLEKKISGSDPSWSPLIQ